LFSLLAGLGVSAYNAPPFETGTNMEKPQGKGLLLIGVGSMLTSMIVAGFVLGYAVDTWADTRPVFMMLLGGLGLVGGFLKVFKLLTRPDL
jgi:ATP synthase protein I